MLKPLAALAFAVLAAPAALACRCMPCDSQPPLLESEYTAGAFVGELLSTRKMTTGDLQSGEEFGVPQQNELIHLFKVTRNLKGDMPKYVMVRSSSSSAACGVNFAFDSLNAVAVSKDDAGKFHAGSCSQMCWGAEPNRSLITEDTMQTWADPMASEE
ncbi:putative lipoprotein [Hyphomonas neptunium ATCC 15444]|uniref:Putative lipoprotein n=2 Tax=Hyphomonas TaxID=85 RepID=Q0C3Y5_HYPNA|nr:MULTISPECIES: hypothetical protein [Hyphomonas]ABI77458.1 putative lipoprotein [Hyphomonas neptunium ATCC 15444]KCZ96229.1 putative lipoprotein [Hyphomonas hirschiana VP5]